MLKTICLFVLLVQSGLVVAQTDKERADFILELETKNFAGWQGITFICHYDESDSVLAEICRKGTAEFKFLITTADIAYNIVDPNDSYGSSFRSGIHGHVVLEYHLFATNESAIKAVYGNLAFINYYSNAVDKEAQDSSMQSLPRTGDLDLWSRNSIGSGPAKALENAFSDSFEIHFKEAITHFLEYGTSRK